MLQEKPRSGTRETSLTVKLETIVNFSLERFLYILKKERTQESFLRSKSFFLLHYRKRGRQHVCKDPDSLGGGRGFLTYNTDYAWRFVHPVLIVLLQR